jgi:hypothetical protein
MEFVEKLGFSCVEKRRNWGAFKYTGLATLGRY